MCVIVHQPKGKYIDKETARNLWNVNPDGGGFAFVDDDEVIQVEKHMSFLDFWRGFETARSTFPERDFLLHMRIATHGAISRENVHPFQIDENSVVAHNGIIHQVTDLLPDDDSISDTRFFVDELLPQMSEGWLDYPFQVAMMEEWMGWSKLLFINTSPKLAHTFYRLGDWEEHKGLFLSNTYGINGKMKKKRSNNAVAWGGYINNNPYKETTEDWGNYQDYKGEVDTIVGDVTIEPDVSMANWELEVLLDAVKNERATMLIGHDIVVIDDRGEPHLLCDGCGEDIDLKAAECACWEKVCGFCWNYIANCDKKNIACQKGAQYNYEDLTDAAKERVHNAQTTFPYKVDDKETSAVLAVVPNRTTARSYPSW